MYKSFVLIGLFTIRFTIVFGSLQYRFIVAQMHFLLFWTLINILVLSDTLWIPCSTTVINFVCQGHCYLRLIAFKIFLLTCANFFLPRFPSSLNGVLYTPSIALLIICGASFSISWLPLLIACPIPAWATRSTSFETYLISFGATASNSFTAWLRVSRAA